MLKSSKSGKAKCTTNPWKKIAGLSNFYRYKNGNFYFRGRVKGKIRTISLDTHDKDIAKRKILEVQRQLKSSRERSLSLSFWSYTETHAEVEIRIPLGMYIAA